MKTSLNLMKSLNESTKPEIKKTRRLREAVENITEGAGAGYHIMGTIENAHVNSFSIAETTEDDYGIPTYILDCDITADFTDVSFESYEYGSKVDMTNIHITKVCLTDNHEPEDKGELNNTNIEQSLNQTMVKSLIGGGWIHQKFEGEVEFDDDNAAGSSYADFYVEGIGYNFTDSDLVNYIDLAVIGENITDEFIVYSADDELERFDSEEEAIEYAKNNPEALKVEQLSYSYEYDGDVDPNSEYSEVVWERDNYEESENSDSRNRLVETTNRGIENMKQDLYSRERQALKDLGDPDWEKLTNLKKRMPEDMYNAFEKEEREIWAISMIHSILTYSEPSNWTVENILSDKYMQDYIKELGEDKIKELINQEIEEYKNNATINKDVHTDSEGVSYNSVTFKNESEDTKAAKIAELEKKIKDKVKAYSKAQKDNNGDSALSDRLESEIDSLELELKKLKESDELNEKLNSNEKIIFSKKVLDSETDDDLKNIANEIRYYSEPTYTKCMEIINGDGSVQYKAGQISDIIYQLNESERLIEEEKVTDNLQEVKSQGNIFMLQDGESKYIVGENYNEEEKLIENAEIYENKEDADKDYFSRCEIKLDDKIVDPTNVDLTESIDNIKLNMQAGKRARIVNKMNNEPGGLEKYHDDLRNIDNKIKDSVNKLETKRHNKINNKLNKDRENGIPFEKTVKKTNKMYDKETNKIVKAIEKSHKND